MPYTQPHPADQKIKEFYERLAKKMEETEQQSTLPKELKSLIARDDLIDIYRTVLRYENIKTQIIATLKAGKPFRWAKEESGLSRTINIIFDPDTNDIFLMLETKSKVIDASDTTIKDIPNTPKFSGTSKTAKPAWRIDSPKPTKYANAVFYAKVKSELKEAKVEASIGRKAAKQKTNTFLNQTTMGPKIKVPGTRSANSEQYESKQSFYSKWASGGSLSDFLKSNKGQNLSLIQSKKLAAQLLLSVKAMHDSNLIHQDIKTSNILVFQDEQGNYNLELADFGLVYDPENPNLNKDALATLGYESPEISVINKKSDAGFHGYFYNMGYPSYGREIAKTLSPESSFKRPHKANDLWSAGVVIHQIFNKGNAPTEQTSVLFTPLLEGLLNPIREDRLTAEQALALLQPQPQVAQPQVVQPQVVQPQVAQPQVAQPQVVQPQVAQPQPPQRSYLSNLGGALKSKLSHSIQASSTESLEALLESSVFRSKPFWNEATKEKILKCLHDCKPLFPENIEIIRLTEETFRKVLDPQNAQGYHSAPVIIVNLLNDITTMKNTIGFANKTELNAVMDLENKLIKGLTDTQRLLAKQGTIVPAKKHR
jgi:serine/threonine protein kinase